MSSFNFCLKIARPQHIILAALTTWVAAMLSNGPHWFTTPKIVSPLVIALSVFGASLYHFGLANPMYTRKSESLAIRNPILLNSLIFVGLLAMVAAVGATFVYLNAACCWVVGLDALIIICYAGFLSRHWLTKNLLIAFVCVSPILLGWFAGHRLHPDVPYSIAAAFFAYLAREIVKDIQDRKANHGYRHTLPLWLGLVPARRIAGACMTVCIIVMVLFGISLRSYMWYVFPSYLLSMCYFCIVTGSLFRRVPGGEVGESKHILFGSGYLVLTYLLMIF